VSDELTPREKLFRAADPEDDAAFAVALNEYRDSLRAAWDAGKLDPVCICTHPRSDHNINGLCIALPGVLGCGCLGWSEQT
jgi:hypothetical protein